jgi:hypothetical protein
VEEVVKVKVEVEVKKEEVVQVAAEVEVEVKKEEVVQVAAEVEVLFLFHWSGNGSTDALLRPLFLR